MQRMEVDCSTGAVTISEMTDQEVADHLAAQDAFQIEHAQVQAQVNEDRMVLAEKAANDPAFAALMRLIGVASL